MGIDLGPPEHVCNDKRTAVDTMIASYYAFREREGMSDEEAIQATLESFPTNPGSDSLRAVLASDAAHEAQLRG